MAQFGNPSSGNAAPSNGFFNDDFGNCQFWSNYSGWPGGIVTDLNVYCAGDQASVTGQLVIWNGSNGTIMWQSGNITLPSGSRSNSGQGWVHVTVPNKFFGAGSLNLGFWSSGNVVWTAESGGVANFQRSVSGGPATLSSGGTEGGGVLGAYVIYTPGNGHVERSGSFAAGPVAVMRSGTFNNGTLWVMRNGTFVQGS